MRVLLSVGLVLAAAAGQIRLAHAWEEALARFDTTVAQVLLTFADTERLDAGVEGAAEVVSVVAASISGRWMVHRRW